MKFDSSIDWKTVIESKDHSIEFKETLVEVDSLSMLHCNFLL